ncbi:LysR substrate-binding domain-containing protein [Rhizobium terrae]|uniref:LysR substrate-binding domain-containing protein n=1 Tax=Rhizobium terrae TaxID=2171756 RepID=UPI0029C0100C|nr:LysR substrate-binding domain-containing protein [Rhizobium terrae]
MTQTAVSYQIKLLEDYLGDAVFIRRPRALQLTETGEQLVPKVTEAFSLLSEAVQTARHRVEETLEIHSPPSFASQWLSPHLHIFKALYPQIEVRLLRQLDNNAHQHSSSDITICISPEPSDDMVSHPLFRLDYAPMLSPRLAESIGGIQEPSDLLKLPWITDTRDWWHEWFEAVHVDQRQVRHASLNALGALDLEAKAAMSGHGVAMLSPFLFRDDLASGRLVQPFDLCVGDGKTYWLCYPQARRNAAKIKAFAGWIEAALAHDLAMRPDLPAQPA